MGQGAETLPLVPGSSTQGQLREAPRGKVCVAFKPGSWCPRQRLCVLSDWEKVKNSAKAEIALRRVLKDEGATAFTTNFDDLGDADIDAPDFCGFD